MPKNEQLDSKRVMQIPNQGPSVYVPLQSIGLPNMTSFAILALMGVGAVVGSSAQVANYQAGFTSINAALAAISPGQTILVLAGTYEENVTVSQNCNIIGQGHATSVTGTWALAPGCSYSLIRNVRFNGNVTVAGAAVGNFISESWQASTYTITESSPGNNSINVWQE